MKAALEDLLSAPTPASARKKTREENEKNRKSGDCHDQIHRFEKHGAGAPDADGVRRSAEHSHG